MKAESPTRDAAPEWLRIVRDQVEHLRFGVVQIERTEKVRFDKPEPRDEK